MRRRIILTIALVSVTVLCIVSCEHKPFAPAVTPDVGRFPDAVGKIIVNKCATTGCHNATSYQNCAGLLLDTWEHLFEGGGSGAAIVPYSPDYSPLLYFVNNDPARGTIATPVMPYDVSGASGNTLSEIEYTTLKGWIAKGAQDKDGNVAFATDEDTRQKIYLTQQGCDLVAVIDAKSNLVMRYIPVGTNNGNIESPHSIRVASDGKNAYVSFLNGTAIQKIDTRTDQVTSSVTLGTGSWNMLYVAPGDTAIAAIDWRSDGKVVYANTGSMTIQSWLTGSGSGTFVFPHGVTSDATFDTCFITAQYGNVVYRYAQKIPHYKKISINGNLPSTTNTGTSPNPHEILMAPGYNKYFLSCEGSNEVRVMDAHTDAILAAIPVGTLPQEMAISHTMPYLFVTCMEDAQNPLAGRKGSVYVINYNTYEIVQVIYGDFYQPHAIAVDDRTGRILIASTNSNPAGPAPHHATTCGGRAGWYNIYNLSTLQPNNPKRYQVAVMPYSADVRFKKP